MLRKRESGSRCGWAHDGTRGLCAGLSDGSGDRRRRFESRVERVFSEIPAGALDGGCGAASGHAGGDDSRGSARSLTQEERRAARLSRWCAVPGGSHRGRSHVSLRSLRPRSEFRPLPGRSSGTSGVRSRWFAGHSQSCRPGFPAHGLRESIPHREDAVERHESGVRLRDSSLAIRRRAPRSR